METGNHFGEIIVNDLHTAIDALLSHCRENLEKEMVRAWAELSFSEELPVTTKLAGRFPGRWGKNEGPAERVRQLVRLVSQDYGIERNVLAQEALKFLPELPHKHKK